MRLALDVSQGSLAKQGEEICGDSLEIVRKNDEMMVVLSDGLGSGVKAGILSTMTVKMAAKLLSRGLPLEETVETINKTLPICKVRGLAYATLNILYINEKNEVRFIQDDAPPLILIKHRSKQAIILEGQKNIIGGKEMSDYQFGIDEGDILIIVSDGVPHAGVGAILELGWGMQGLMKYVQKQLPSLDEPEEWVEEILEVTRILYSEEPGDDATVVAIRARKPRSLMLVSGPPKDQAKDEKLCKTFQSFEGRKVICGGATANMVAKKLQRNLETELEYSDPSVPPTAKMEGVNLVTEGILTINKAIERLKGVLGGENLKPKDDGATLLAKELIQSEEIFLHIGTAINPAHKALAPAITYPDRIQAFGELVHLLERLGKKVEIQWY
ncbi:MAG TPA: SpoIIE family protein phosphatase [Firmicutes bacterium]|jgi:hypothetical protein|nr:SpoIIE family protein phosphatase [Bacillota bacterium]